MAANRYGQIWHGDHHHINLRFPSVDARQEFADKFSEYHGSHDHDGEAPRFELAKASDVDAGSSNVTIHDVKDVTLDGYCAHEIEAYHERTHKQEYTRYRPPTCCVSPIISINREFVLSHTLERHELSAIFGDIPEDEYQSLLASVQRDGFIDEVIKLYDGKILDGWHRYCAARELNLIRKLRFQVWHEDERRDGDPKAFVLGRNLNRRHYSAAQRAQVFVAFNERFGHGGDRKSDDESSRQNGDLKSREQLAKEAGVGKRTIDRAIVVEKEGESEAVIHGEKTTGEVLKARDAATAKKRKQQVLKNLWDIRKQAATDYVGDSDNDLNQYLTQDDLEKGFVKNNETYAEAFGSGMQRIDAAAGGGFKAFEDRAFEVDEFGNAKVDVSELEEEYRALMTYAGDIRQWKRPDWSPDTNWILPLIEQKKAKASEDTAEKSDEVAERDELKTLREQVKAEMPKWKQRYKESGKEESELVSRASFSALIHVKRHWEKASGVAMEEDAATVEELKELLKLLKNDSYAFIYRLRDYLRDTEQVESDSAEADKSGAEPEEDTVESLWEKITPAISAWKADRKGKGVGHASKTMFLSATKCFDSELTKDSETDVVLLKKLLDLLTEVHGPGYTFERYVKMQCDGASIWEDNDDASEAHHHDDRNRVTSEEESDEDWRLDDRMDRCRIDLLEVWQQAWTWEGLEILLYAEEYGIDVDVIAVMQREIAAEHPAPLENTMTEMESIEKFDARLKEFGAHEELVCDSLHFYYGIERADLSETPQETLVEIRNFIEEFIDKPLEEWPEWIRNHVPKRELVLVSIGVSNNTDDEFEMVEFTDESSDEVWCKLDELPQELKNALFKLAVKKIVESEEA